MAQEALTFEDVALDPGTGSIDGLRAVAVYPAVFDAEGKPKRFFDPRGFVAHLVPSDQFLEGSNHPCGEWFLPPRPDQYAVWVEGPGWMSPYPRVVGYAGSEFEGRGFSVVVPVVAAGQVRLPARTAAPELRAWLLWAERPRRHDLGGEMARLERLGEAGALITMPAGRVIAGLWDRRRQAFRALSRPFEVPAGGSVETSFVRPAGGDVIVRLERATAPSGPEDLDVELWLDGPGREARRADLVAVNPGSAHAVWFDVAPGPASLSGGSRESGIAPVALDVVAGEVATITGVLRRRPRLEVGLELPVGLSRSALMLELRRAGDRSVVVAQPVTAGSRLAVFEALPLEALRIELQTEIGVFDEDVDLRDGQDRRVELSPEVISLHGDVYYGDATEPARISFSTVERKEITVVTDEEGHYEVALLEPVRFATVFLSRVDTAPYSDFFPRAVDGSRELDFHLSDVVLRVRVVDALTHEGIGGASVGVRAALAGTGDGAHDNAGLSSTGDRVVQRLVADDSGEVVLPPPRKGELAVYARAEGYRELAEPLTIRVDETLADGEYRIGLVPIGDTLTLRLTLQDGRAAAAARVVVIDSVSGGQTLFDATADAAGAVDLPRGLVGRLALVTHPESAFLLEECGADGDSDVRWTLPPRAPRPLRLEVRDATGEDPLPHAAVVLWIGGRRLQGRVLSLATETYWQADGAGAWIASSLPAADVAVAAWSAASEPGGLEAVATTSTYPWPDPVIVRAVE